MKKKYFIPLIAFAVITFSNCSKSPILGVDNCLDRIEAVSVAAQTYIANPTVDNCQNYVDALRKYLDAKSCFGNIYFDEYRKALAELEEAECK